MHEQIGGQNKHARTVVGHVHERFNVRDLLNPAVDVLNLFFLTRDLRHNMQED